MTFRNAEYPLLDNASATGTGVEWPGGKGVFSAYKGTFGGATVKLQWSLDAGTTWLDVDRSGDTYTTLTAAGSGIFELPECLIRASVASGSPSALFATAKVVR